MRLEIVSKYFGNGDFGYDIKLNEDGACVQDYLDALNAALVDLNLSRSRQKTTVCRGCDLCCAERIPLTSIDLEILAASPHAKVTLNDTGDGLPKMIKRFCHVYVNGRSVDITLRLGEDGKCVFLDRETKTCSVYDFRPFVCQTFICCSASPQALELREVLVNAGEDELVRRWLEYVKAATMELWYDEADDPDVDFSDWDEGPFTGKKSYSQLLLKNLLPEDLWNKLRHAS